MTEPTAPTAKKLSIDQFKVDPKKATAADIEAAMQLLALANFKKARVKAGEVKGSQGKKIADMTPEELKKRRAMQSRMIAKQTLIKRKAKAAGITVTEAEVDAYIKAKG
jgi:hypothetical protein